jgi:hypothetical protein
MKILIQEVRGIKIFFLSWLLSYDYCKIGFPKRLSVVKIVQNKFYFDKSLIIIDKRKNSYFNIILVKYRKALIDIFKKKKT